MKRLTLLLLAVFLLFNLATAFTTAAGPYDKYLTVADVEKVSGLTGIKIVPKNPAKGAGGDLNFATSDGKLVLMALFSGASLYAPSKQQAGYFKAAVPGVGSEAFSGPKNDPQFVLCFKKGVYCVTLSSFFNIGGDAKHPTMLTMDQLIALGKLVAPRIK